MTHAISPFPSCVAAYPRRHGASQHEIATQLCLAHQFAQLLRCAVQEPYQPGPPHSPTGYYYIPDETLIGSSLAHQLGIHDASHFFGGMVPHDFVASKAITHGVYKPTSIAPAGWSRTLAESLGDAVLTGYTAFTQQDLLQAGFALLDQGSLRLKPIYANAGRGQYVVRHPGELRRVIAKIKDCERGVVLEENLDDVKTYSVGWCHVGHHTLAYVGTQELTQDNQGKAVYGGSYLRCILGPPDALMALDMTPDARRAIVLAMRYDAAVSQAYPSLTASRRNYDVAFGKSATGEDRAGVLEQSWRAGGASVAEAAALLHLTQHPDCNEVDAYTCERYGDKAPPNAPPDDIVYHGKDARVGQMTKTGGIVRNDHGGT